eukprot:TRINITY_DN95857_c0_g1_i1.p1 TRINITY_DN95857_c0_g1~~TRINITY_DN95857_c0_g1_i1.p1  ORF type:complete len:414 (-),score=55.22 TRINITY_DN95857_c0_g1_i1:32-1273(-)
MVPLTVASHVDPTRRQLVTWRALAKTRVTQASRPVLLLMLLRILYTLYRRRRSNLCIPKALAAAKLCGDHQRQPFLAFSGSGLLMAYFHGVVTYIRDHFHVDNLRLSAISGGCSTILALAMGIDLYQILILGLYHKQRVLREGLYLNSFSHMVEEVVKSFTEIGITDEDVAQLSERKQCFIGVTQCFPPQHCCMPTPATLRDLAALWLSSCSVVPFFRTPGEFQGKYYVDGGFSAVYSVPDDQPWDEVTKVTCFPWWSTLFPPALGVADIQPTHFMPDSVVIMYPWSHQLTLIKRGYEDAKKQHAHLVSRGFRPLSNAPVTPWEEWQKLFEAVDEDNLPALSSFCTTNAASEAEKKHMELLRTYSHSDLQQSMEGSRLRRLNNGQGGSQSEANIASLAGLADALAVKKGRNWS